MAAITAESVKELREKTGAGMMDCKSALSEANGNFEVAIEILRKKGLKDIGKRSGKVAAEGTLGVYVHQGDQVVAVVELNCETDFVARCEEFKNLAKDLAMQVAAMKPIYLTAEEVPAALVQKEKEILMEQLDESQKAKADKILPGRIQKFYEDVVLLQQSFVKEDSKKIEQLIQEVAMKIGEKIVVRRFSRLEVGEGIEKAQTNLAAEVAAMTAA